MALCSTIDLHLCNLEATAVFVFEVVLDTESRSLHGTGGMLPSLTTALRLLLAATGVLLSRGGSGLLAHNTLKSRQNINKYETYWQQ